MKVLQINTTVNSGSTGRIAEDIGKALLLNGHESFIAYGRGNRPSSSKLIKIGGKWDQKMHGLKSRLLDRHGFGSVNATNKLISKINEIQPDLVHLHNIHGYYINVEILFSFLKLSDIPVVWTFHDCWPFTGHCSYFDRISCEKWKNGCSKCPNLKGYPQSWLIDNSEYNYHLKKKLFTSIKNMVIVTPSVWLSNHVKNSFFNKYPVKVINNGVDMNIFKPQCAEDITSKYHLYNKKTVLGVANLWDRRKGLDDFIQLRNHLDCSINIVLVGLKEKQINSLPHGITGITRTENINELAFLYSSANTFVNPTYIDNFPTTNIEALSCGTPVITYNTGGSPEIIDEYSGCVVDKGDINGLVTSINMVLENNQDHFRQICRNRAETFYNKTDRLNDYLCLYNNMINKSNQTL